MKLIEPYVTVIPQADPLIHIEKIGRTCYKSMSDFTHETSIKFFKGLVNSGHHSVLEHATFIFKVDMEQLSQSEHLCISQSKYLNWTQVLETNHAYRCIVSGNLRAIKESGCLGLMYTLLKAYPDMESYFEISDIKSLESYYTSPFTLIPRSSFLSSNPNKREIDAHLYTSIAFLTDRGVTHEMVRHRPASYSQESTRYCNYSNERFGRELEFIKPATFDEWRDEERYVYIDLLEKAEIAYMKLTQSGLKAQLARGVLPTDIRTRIVMTANHREWEHFFNLRSLGTTGSPHPNMKKVADMAMEAYNEYNKF